MQSLEDIYQAHARTVFKYLMTLTAQEDLAQELTQETFYQAVRSIHKYDESCKITTWLCAIAKNQYLNYMRKNKRYEGLEEIDKTAQEPSAEEKCLAGLTRVELLRQLHACPEPYREVLYLRIFGNLSFQEIGDIMDKTENWARVTYYRGKQKLKSEVEQHEI